MPPTGRHVTIPSVQGHVAASPGYKPADLEFIKLKFRDFMAVVTNNWQSCGYTTGRAAQEGIARGDRTS
jgi:hypothetical protein